MRFNNYIFKYLTPSLGLFIIYVSLQLTTLHAYPIAIQSLVAIAVVCLLGMVLTMLIKKHIHPDLNRLNSPAFIIDNSGLILSLNSRAQALLNHLDIQKQYINQPYNSLHPDLKHSVNFSSESTHFYQITIGDKDIAITHTPTVLNNQYLVYWNIIKKASSNNKINESSSEQKYFEKSLEQCHFAAIKTDANGHIDYMNQEAITLLTSLNEWLEIPQQDLLNSPYYKIHRKLFDNQSIFTQATQLPYSTELDIGHEIVSMYATPLENFEEHFIGALIIWEKVTKDKNRQRWESVVGDEIQNSTRDLLHASNAFQSLIQNVDALADNTSTESQNVAAYSQQIGEEVNHLSVAVEQTSATIREISNNVDHNLGISIEAAREADHTSEILVELNDMTSAIGKAARKIDKIVEQTRMLSLNATIEAARAGEAGKGFAVVASEVKTLALQTEEFTVEINKLIEAILKKIPQTVQSIHNVQGTISTMQDSTNSIQIAMEEQTITIRDMAEHMREADNGLASIIQKMQTLAQQSEQNSIEVSNGLESAQVINELAQTFEIISKRFSEERIVKPSDVYRLMLILNNMLNALIDHTCSNQIIIEAKSLKNNLFQDKKPTDVLKKSIETVRFYLTIMGLPESDIRFPSGTVTPTQVYDFTEQFVFLVENTLKNQKIDNIQILKRAKPVDNKVPSDVFSLIDLAYRKLTLLQTNKQLSLHAN